MWFLFAVAGAWMAIGLTVALILGRRGHDPFTWLVVGTVLGPLGAVLALDSVLHDEGLRPKRLVTVPRPVVARDQAIDVLAGIDGSAHALEALDAALELVGPRLGRLTLATVIPFDGGRANDTRAEQLLTDLRSSLGRPVTLEVLHGPPATALLQRAEDDGYELLVAGTRGAGGKLFGSAAAELAAHATVPLLLVGDHAA